MHTNQALTIGRVTRVLDERLRPAIYSDPQPVEIAEHVVGGEPIPVADGLAADYTLTKPGAAWGRAWDTTWFRLTGGIPESFAGRRVEIVCDLGFDKNMPGFQHEGLVYTPDGEAVRSLNPRAMWIPVAESAKAGAKFEYFVEAASNPVILDYHPFLPTRQGEWQTAGEDPLYRIRRVDIAIFEHEVFELVHDVEVLLQLAIELPGDSTRRARILAALDRALDRVDLHRIAETATAARDELKDVLASPAEASAHQLTAVGHAHIDSAWLWPLRETVRKVARTCSSMATLLDEDDDFIYAMSSAQQYAWMRDERPEVFARVKQAVADGRFVPIGGMWIEPDAVLPSGESFVRQITYGQRFFREEFGIECRGAWLPDSFGYSGALPQILKGAGFEWFLTQKISWNQVNVFPHHSFEWEGIDGSRIFTHFPPMDTYNSELSGMEVAKAARQFKEKAVASSSLAPVGWGDGGGGTTREMVARGKRMKNLEGSPQVRFEDPNTFFERAMAELPMPGVWVGELYLELHRGTFTTQHKTKQGNRLAQRLLFEAELWCTVAAVRAGFDYPYDVLDDAWRETLLFQFHDILPGTSIAWVHREVEERAAKVAETLEGVIADALAALGVKLGSEIDTEHAADAAAAPLTVRSAPAGQDALAVSARVAPAKRELRREGREFVIESDAVRIRIDEDGLVTSMLHLADGREAIPSGLVGNLLQIHQDFPNMWDAWDVDRHYYDMVENVTEAMDVRIEGDEVIIDRAFGDSMLRQRLTLDERGEMLVIDNSFEWHEREKFAKLTFPVDVLSHHVAAETQYGFLERTNHDNTSWEDARFETQCQNWFLVQEGSFGVAFLNDSSHGFDVTRGMHDGRVYQNARFSLLRSPLFPDPEADQGAQRMRLGVLVGADPLTATVAGHELNTPLREASGEEVAPIVSVEAESILVSAVKLADDRSGDVIVRVYEAAGARGSGSLWFDAPGFTSVRRVDLVERPLDGYEPAEIDGTVALSLGAFEVQTFRFSK